MATPGRRLLFSWGDVELLPDLKRLKFVWENLPEDAVVEELERLRGRGRDDYPVCAMWRALVVRVVLQHDTDASFLRELDRNPALLSLCGFDALGRQSAPVVRLERTSGGLRRVEEPSPRRSGAPTPAAFSRFVSSVAALEGKGGTVSGLVDALRGTLMSELLDYGRSLGADGKAIRSHSTGRTLKGKGRTSDPDADWGAHSHRGLDRRTGKARERTSHWFGYKLHLIADVKHELPVAFSVERASVSEQTALPRDLRRLFESEPLLAERCVRFRADRGYDQADLKAWRRSVTPEVQVSGGGLRLGVRWTCAVQSKGGRGGGRLRADPAHPAQAGGPAHLHADAPRPPDLAAGLRPVRRPGAHQRPHQRRLPLRAAQHPRQG